MITYRSFKKLLGETSLERKCRYLFGAALLALITGSFWLHAARTRQQVRNQQIVAARTLVPTLFALRHHQRYSEQHAMQDGGDNGTSQQALLRFQELVSKSEKEFESGIQWNLADLTETPADEAGHEARRRFTSGEKYEWPIFEDNDDGTRTLRYFLALRATESCLRCHTARNPFGATVYEPGQHVGEANVALPMAEVDKELDVSRAIFVGLGILTTGLAMLAVYIIVRYIIVKPVLHLKDVSDAIAMGNLNQRAEINTGDEFEELSHAFNRMLRHMTTVNGELRSVNDSLDSQVDLLAQANMELFNSNRLKDDFLATISHELRTPLNSILGFSDILANAKNLDDRQYRFVENIQKSGRSLMVQINDLLDLAKIESGQMKVQAGSVNAEDLIDQLVQQAMPLAEQKNIELRVSHHHPSLPEMHQDAAKLRQILTNLLSNAIKFTPEGGRVRVSSRWLPTKTLAPQMLSTSGGNGQAADRPDSLESETDLVEFAVEDTGIGIPLHEQENIFEKFRQGSTLPGQRDHVKREYGGTGLGLSIVRELSRLLGGDVALQSEFGKGSVFTVTLPVHFNAVELSAPPQLDSPSNILSGITSVDLLSPNEDAASRRETE